jgi:SAM-dependent methyltransferase
MSKDSYHRYVFDSAKREFVGDFEAMYQAERHEGFDSWNQSAPNLARSVSIAHVTDRRWDSILEAGCGKGYVAKELAAVCSKVIGIDASVTAIEIAQTVAPQVQFECWTLEDFPYEDRPSELVVFLEVLSYIERWREVLERAIATSSAVLVSLYLPENPMGFVKSRCELDEQVSMDLLHTTTVDHDIHVWLIRGKMATHSEVAFREGIPR